jgi:hypothetical protein
MNTNARRVISLSSFAVVFGFALSLAVVFA